MLIGEESELFDDIMLAAKQLHDEIFSFSDDLVRLQYEQKQIIDKFKKALDKDFHPLVAETKTQAYTPLLREKRLFKRAKTIEKHTRTIHHACKDGKHHEQLKKIARDWEEGDFFERYLRLKHAERHYSGKMLTVLLKRYLDDLKTYWEVKKDMPDLLSEAESDLKKTEEDVVAHVSELQELHVRFTNLLQGLDQFVTRLQEDPLGRLQPMHIKLEARSREIFIDTNILRYLQENHAQWKSIDFEKDRGKVFISKRVREEATRRNREGNVLVEGPFLRYLVDSFGAHNISIPVDHQLSKALEPHVKKAKPQSWGVFLRSADMRILQYACRERVKDPRKSIAIVSHDKDFPKILDSADKDSYAFGHGTFGLGVSVYDIDSRRKGDGQRQFFFSRKR